MNWLSFTTRATYKYSLLKSMKFYTTVSLFHALFSLWRKAALARGFINPLCHSSIECAKGYREAFKSTVYTFIFFRSTWLLKCNPNKIIR